MKYIKKVSASYQGDTPIATSISSSSTNDEVAGAKAVYDNSLDTYSTTEQRVGTWIDGKPIYRKVLIKNPLVVSNNVAVIGTIEPNIETITNCSWFVSGTDVPAGMTSWRTGYLNSDYYSGVQCEAKNGVLEIGLFFKDGNASSSKKAFAIVEYTKTTDSAS